MALFTIQLQSRYLQGPEKINVIMPDRPRKTEAEEFYSRPRRYPVLWLLHGGMGDYSDWVRKTNIEQYACENELVVVMPSAMNSMYTDWPGYATGYDMFSFFFKELMPFIYKCLPVSDRREDNFICGLSMGGMGTLKFTLNKPECFAKAGVLSYAPFRLPDDEDLKNGLPVYAENEMRAHGGMENWCRSRDDMWYLAETEAGDPKLPEYYFAVGDQDGLYPRFCRFSSAMKEAGFPGEFHVVEGYAHEWRFWEKEIQSVLSFFGFRAHERG